MYRSDWADGMKPKTLPTILFLYFACLAPAVAFGGISYGLTKGACLACVVSIHMLWCGFALAAVAAAVAAAVVSLDLTDTDTDTPTPNPPSPNTQGRWA